MMEEILRKARWYYIPYQPYKTFYHLIVENDIDDWMFYYLENISAAGRIADVSGIGDLSIFTEGGKTVTKLNEPKNEFLNIEIPEEYKDIPIDNLFRNIEYQPSSIDRDLSGCGVVRKIHGNLGTMIHEFLKIVK